MKKHETGKEFLHYEDNDKVTDIKQFNKIDKSKKNYNIIENVSNH
jgi:hypothetical protein